MPDGKGEEGWKTPALDLLLAIKEGYGV